MLFKGWWHPPLVLATAFQIKASLVYRVSPSLAKALYSDPVSKTDNTQDRITQSKVGLQIIHFK